MKYSRRHLFGFSLAGLGAWLGISEAAASDYPPVSALQDQLPCHPNDLLPKLINWRGRMFQPRYLQAEAHSDGKYVVTLKLDKVK